MLFERPRTWIAAVVISGALGIHLTPALASARRTGIVVQGCDGEGCHGGGRPPELDVSWVPATPAPGDQLAISIAIEAINGPVGGLYVRADAPGTLRVGSDMTKVTERDFTHTTPRRATNGWVTFNLLWDTPADPAGALLEIWAVSADDNGRPTGDAGGTIRKSVVVGCEGTTFYRDLDGDGYGRDHLTRIDCAPSPGWAPLGGDCDDNDPDVNPGEMEVCNGRDDNCSGVIDDGHDLCEHDAECVAGECVHLGGDVPPTTSDGGDSGSPDAAIALDGGGSSPAAYEDGSSGMHSTPNGGSSEQDASHASSVPPSSNSGGCGTVGVTNEPFSWPPLLLVFLLLAWAPRIRASRGDRKPSSPDGSPFPLRSPLSPREKRTSKALRRGSHE